EIAMVHGLQLDREAAFRALANCGRESPHAGDHWGRCRLYKAGRCGTIGNENYIGTPRSPMPQQANQALPAGYVLNGYRIEKPLSSGGFSIVYLARDESGTPFAIKEYLPASLPLRDESLEIKLDEESTPVFRHGLKCFFEEGR